MKLQFEIMREDAMTIGDYNDYMAALADLDLVARIARRNPPAARALRHKANAALATLAARYGVSANA